MQNIKNKNHSLPLTSQSVLQETETETDRRNLLASEVLEKVCTPTKTPFLTLKLELSESHKRFTFVCLFLSLTHF